MNERRLENLKPYTSDQSHEEAVKNGRKGGIASGEARRRRADMRRAMEALLLDEHTIKGKKVTGLEAISMSMFKIASDPKNKGAVSAYKAIMQVTGQDKPELGEETISDETRESVERLIQSAINSDKRKHNRNTD